MAGGWEYACFNTISVKTPGPVRSNASMEGWREKVVATVAAILSTAARRAGWPGAAAKSLCWSCLERM